ncbi:MAG: NUDIX domain-containing protein, partial [Candidatus Adlerbacteria bacterium]|nr:NUDIX domain-containing protein [Candidatus Adlerbacteria bacterium]
SPADYRQIFVYSEAVANIVFVDKDDNPIGAGTRQEASEKGLICRIVRIFIFNSKGQLLLQKRGPNVSIPDKWDDSVAGHVDEGEDYLEAAHREMAEEMGVKGVELTKVATYYTERFDPNDKRVVGRRFNTLYKTIYDGEVTPDPDEIADVQWIELPDLKKWLAENPEDFAPGFRDAFKEFQKYI